MIKGFICPLRQGNISFEECFAGCPCRCLGLPILKTITEDLRDLIPGQYSTTEILNPAWQIYLTRHTDYWIKPENMLWVLYGTAFHNIIERQKNNLGDDFLVEHENSFAVNIKTPEGSAILTGRPDQYQISTKTLTDYKTMAYFMSGKFLIKDGRWDDSKYQWQLNIYRRYQFPDCEKMYLEIMLRDWTKRLGRQEDVRQIEWVEVPWIPDDEVDAKVRELLTEILRGEKDPKTLRVCGEKDRWKNDIRCLDYCAVNTNCRYYQENYGEKTLDMGAGTMV